MRTNLRSGALQINKSCLGFPLVVRFNSAPLLLPFHSLAGIGIAVPCWAGHPFPSCPCPMTPMSFSRVLQAFEGSAPFPSRQKPFSVVSDVLKLSLMRRQIQGYTNEDLGRPSGTRGPVICWKVIHRPWRSQRRRFRISAVTTTGESFQNHGLT